MAPDARAATMSVSLVGTVGVGAAVSAVPVVDRDGDGDGDGEQLTTSIPATRRAVSRSGRTRTKWSFRCGSEAGGTAASVRPCLRAWTHFRTEIKSIREN